MSYIESLLIYNTQINVPCQTDLDFGDTSNQCSWCAGLFALNYKKLIHTFLTDKSEFLNIYRECLETGTRLRKEYGKCLYGENIDNKILLNKLKLSDNIFFIASYDKNNSDDFLVKIPDELKNEFYNKKGIKINDFDSLLNYKFSLISRHCQSFILITVNDSFLVLDSHVHTIGLMSKENAFRYIKYQHFDDSEISGYLYVTILCGA